MFQSSIVSGLFLIAILTGLALLMGEYMARVFNGRIPGFMFLFKPLEKISYKLFRIKVEEEQNWKTYVWSMLIFNFLGMVFLFGLQVLQQHLPFNPQKFGPVRWDTALNTAISFVTNTNWQSYAGEQTMSYLVQMLGLTVQNFLSAATGIAVAIAFFRGFIRQGTEKIGNFWVDMTRCVVYILLPLSIILGVIFISQGSIQNLLPNTVIHTIEGRTQTITQGPVASEEVIKQLGTNGGGFFNANSAHPFENPNPFTDFLQVLTILLISAGLPFTFGAMQGKRKQGWALYAIMLFMFVGGLIAILVSELHGNPILAKLGITHGISMEGKEVRFGPVASAFFAHITTVTSCGAVNNIHDSLMPLSGMICILNIALGEVIFGGVGTGIQSVLFHCILAMFLVGLMIGRTPEVFGKKLQPKEMIWVVVGIIASNIIQLVLGAVAISTKTGLSSLGNAGPHGLSEILYAFASGAGNNGSAFGGLNAGTVFYNLMIGLDMIIGRYTVLVPAVILAGSLASKRLVPEASRFPTTGWLFIFTIIGVILITGALTFFPFVSIGPVLEHLFMNAGMTF